MHSGEGLPELTSLCGEDPVTFVKTQSTSALFQSERELSLSTAVANSDLADQLLRIHEYERQRMGQELHDSAGQLLISLQLSVAHLRQVEEDGWHRDLIEEIQATIRQIDQQIRALAFLHYPVELRDGGLSSTIQSLALGFGRRTGIHTTFKAAGDLAPVDEASSAALLRVAQEALVNIHRHAHASKASVTLKRRARSVELKISDDGIGMPATAAARNVRGIGLQGMHHRIERIGGTLRLTPLAHGTMVTATVPIAA